MAQVLAQGLMMRVSPLARCQQLAQSLSALRPDLSWHTDERLREMNFGQWEGVAWQAIPRDAFAAWTADFWDHRFGGEESLAEVMARVAEMWDEAQAQGLDQVWITHAGVIRAASLLARGVRSISQASQWPLTAPDYGNWLSLEPSA
jgi:alpha-ribazole phosphatase